MHSLHAWRHFAYLGGVIDKSAHHVFVYISTRVIAREKIDSILKAEAHKGMKLVVLDRASLLALYGPTLRRHPAFDLQDYVAQATTSSTSPSSAVVPS